MRTAIHDSRKVHAMPVNRGGIVQRIVHIHLDLISLIHDQGGSSERIIVECVGEGLIAGGSQLREGILHRQHVGRPDQRIRNPQGVILGGGE